VTYLLVSDRDGRILAEFEFLEDALAALEQLREQGDDDSDAFLARFDDRPGAVFGATLLLKIRVGLP
jgi:hypothetical protein